MELKDTVALITGGASGLGEACARRLLNAGGKVVLLDRNEKLGKEREEELGASCRFAKADVTSEEEVQAAVQTALGEFGGLHVTLNCAGVGAAMRVVTKNGPDRKSVV